AIARPEVEGGHRLAEGHGRVLDDRHVSGRCAHHPAQQLVGLPYRGLGFVLCLVAPDRRLALEMRRDRLEHWLGHERRASVVQVNPVPAPRCLAAPAVELGWGGGEGGRSSGGHVGKVRGTARETQGGGPMVMTRPERARTRAMRPTSCVPNTARASPWAARSSSCPASTA